MPDRDPTKQDVAASVMYALQACYGYTTIDGSQMEGLTWTFDGRDYELVIDDAGDVALDGTIWDNTDEDPVQIVTVRLRLEVIA